MKLFQKIIIINMSEKIILEKQYSSILLKSSFLFAITSLCGLYLYLYHNMEAVDVLINNTMLFFSSINYWRKPVYGFRRNFDIGIVILNFVYNPYSVFHYSWIYIVLSLMFWVVVFYVFSNFLHYYNYCKIGTFCHVLVHLCGVLAIGTIFLGTSQINKF